MPSKSVKIVGLEAFRRALIQNPIYVAKEARMFLVRAMALYKREIRTRPWVVGRSGGGVPVDTGNLRDTHKTQFKKLSARLYPTARYAKFVHDGTSRQKARPWLDYAKQEKEREVKQLEKNLLKNITKKLAD